VSVWPFVTLSASKCLMHVDEMLTDVDGLVMTTLELTSPSHIYTSEKSEESSAKEAGNL
jgi:hypothetical protein